MRCPLSPLQQTLPLSHPAPPPILPQVPEGATPRTISVHLRGELCRSMKAGDVVVLTGVFLPEPVQGFKAMRAGLLTTTYLLVGVRGARVQREEGCEAWSALQVCEGGAADHIVSAGERWCKQISEGERA